jgi:L-cysteate sulfo-lyase
MLSNEALLGRVARYPRIKLGESPTPLEYLPHLSAQVKREVFLKRDDYLGPGLGGNKTRKLEYLLADALQRGPPKVVTFGGLQSNHARITAAAARKLGLEPHLFYFERHPPQLKGNLRVNQLLGAKMHFIPFGAGNDGNMTLETTNLLVHTLAKLLVGRHYFIPVGGHNWLGCLGYVRAALEIEAQTERMGFQNARLVLAAGTGGTLAGLLAGLTLINSPLQVIGIDVGKLWNGFRFSVSNLAEELCARLGEKHDFPVESIPLIEELYAAPRYGTPSPAGMEAIKQLARTEGILLDPIYTGKAFAGMIDLIRKGKLGTSEPIIFLHTGGLPALFEFNRYD